MLNKQNGQQTLTFLQKLRLRWYAFWKLTIALKACWRPSREPCMHQTLSLLHYIGNQSCLLVVAVMCLKQLESNEMKWALLSKWRSLPQSKNEQCWSSACTFHILCFAKIFVYTLRAVSKLCKARIKAHLVEFGGDTLPLPLYPLCPYTAVTEIGQDRQLVVTLLVETLLVETLLVESS
mgnify:CR=1 FL=1